MIVLNGVGVDDVDVQAVTGLGDAVLASPALSHPLTLTILAGLAWPDSPSSTKVYPTVTFYVMTSYDFRLQHLWTWCCRECLS